MPTKDHHTLFPVLACLFAATLWGVMWYPLRVLEAWGLSGLWASLIIYISALLPVLPSFWPQRHAVRQWPYTLVIMGIASGWANLGFIMAVLQGNVVRVLLLFYLMPVWSVLLGWFLLDERLSKPAWCSVGLALTGAVIMFWQPQGVQRVLAAADILAISAGFAFAAFNVCVRKAGDIPLVLKIVPSSLGVAVMSILGILILQSPVPAWTAPGLLLSIVLGSIGVLTMMYATQYGATHLPVHRSAVLFLFEIVAGAISAALLTDEVTTRSEWVGGALVVLAAWLTALEAVTTSKKRTS